MAANLLAKGSVKRVFYAPSMQSLSVKLKLFGRAMTSITLQNKSGDSAYPPNSPPLWPNTDPDFPMPGNIGMDMRSIEHSNKVVRTSQKYESLASALLQLENEAFRKYHVLGQFVATQLENDDGEPPFQGQNQCVECKVQTCPSILKKDFQKLFSNLPNVEDDFTIITISQATLNDMTAWSEEVEEERDMLTKSFIENATEICRKVKQAGYWADFIDPSSGQAYYSEHRNETLCETDDRFNQLGFQVEDLGCCKVLMHKLWKSNVFVGIIFTNAPVQSHVFDDM